MAARDHTRGALAPAVEALPARTPARGEPADFAAMVCALHDAAERGQAVTQAAHERLAGSTDLDAPDNDPGDAGVTLYSRRNEVGIDADSVVAELLQRFGEAPDDTIANDGAIATTDARLARKLPLMREGAERGAAASGAARERQRQQSVARVPREKGGRTTGEANRAERQARLDELLRALRACPKTRDEWDRMKADERAERALDLVEGRRHQDAIEKARAAGLEHAMPSARPFEWSLDRVRRELGNRGLKVFG